MTFSVPQDQRQTLAQHAVGQFTDRFGEPHRLLAYHAALPLVLTPELLNYLRTYFLLDQVPWVAEVDLLLSDLCRPVGYELYVMHTDVRAYLFHQMEQTPELGTPRMQAVARLLISYVRALHQANPKIRQQELQGQQWAAMLVLEDQRQEAIRQLVEAFQQAMSSDGSASGQPLIHAAEMARLAQLTKELAPQLAQYPDFMRYADLVKQLQKAPDRMTDPSQIDQTFRVGDFTLPSLSRFLPRPPQESPVESGQQLQSPIRNRWAVLLGINHYIDFQFSDFKFCVKDVRELEIFLTELGYTVICLHDDQTDSAYQPTRANIEAAFNRLVDLIQPDDLLFVHFSGHTQVIDQRTVLVAQDTRSGLLNEQSISLATITALMKESRARQLVLSLDAGKVGADIGQSRAASSLLPYPDSSQTSFAILSASTEHQMALEPSVLEHGLYTYYLLEALRGNADLSAKGFVTIADVYEFVVNAIEQWGQQHKQEPPEPILLAMGLDEIILADYRDRPITPNEDLLNSLGITLQPFEFDVAEVVLEAEPPPPEPSESLQSFEFETVTVDRRGESIQREVGQAFYFEEPLVEEGVSLEMVAIPGGSFWMGSPEDEPERFDTESPQHEVTIPPFFMGKYPVTQTQWKAVAAMPQVNRELDPDPSRFKGENRPVERVSWWDAVEFCDRLSVYTGREYRLPSEAEWEYGCRAGTTTPFHFGETITTDLANYNGNYTYGEGPKGVDRQETTPVGSFPANAFGLYDLHGNVWEWCADHWHDNYQGAPEDGGAWMTGGNEDRRVLRGGSWFSHPRSCRSACRFTDGPDYHFNYYGFRVVCSPSRALP